MRNSIVLLAKQSGKTSFSSLWQVKNALGTKKVGHTGTLDNFADGLLVLLTGSLTRLCSYITACDKEYHARIMFGKRTDTLDPHGSVIESAPLPDVKNLLSIVPSFTGTLSQIPPEYSAIHVDGKRSSDRIRSGESVQLVPRTVTIHALELISLYSPEGTANPGTGPVLSADIRVHCSKGTYIRSLARDIGIAAGSCAHTSVLRRTAVGPFRLENAAGVSLLPPFGIHHDDVPSVPFPDIQQACGSFTEDLAHGTGLPVVHLKKAYHDSFLQGKKPDRSWFVDADGCEGKETAVFMNTEFCGIVHELGGRLVYDFVFRDS